MQKHCVRILQNKNGIIERCAKEIPSPRIRAALSPKALGRIFRFTLRLTNKKEKHSWNVNCVPLFLKGVPEPLIRL